MAWGGAGIGRLFDEAWSVCNATPLQLSVGRRDHHSVDVGVPAKATVEWTWKVEGGTPRTHGKALMFFYNAHVHLRTHTCPHALADYNVGFGLSFAPCVAGEGVKLTFEDVTENKMTDSKEGEIKGAWENTANTAGYSHTAHPRKTLRLHVTGKYVINILDLFHHAPLHAYAGVLRLRFDNSHSMMRGKTVHLLRVAVLDTTS